MATKISFLDLMAQGGPIMWVLLGASVLALGVIVQKGLTLVIARNRDKRFGKELEKALRTPSGLLAANKLCATSRGPMAAMVATGLTQRGRGREEIEESMASTALRELKRLGRGISVLSTTANLAPLLGFLGTVTGMMVAFDAIAGKGLEEPGLVAVGIKEALTTTAAGLTVAIPAQLAYNLLQGQLDEITHRLETAGELLAKALTDS